MRKAGKRDSKWRRAVAGGALLVAALTVGVTAGAPQPRPASAAGLCGPTGRLSPVSKVMVVWEENRALADIVGSSSAPYINHTLITECGIAKNFTARASGGHSLSNYLEELTAQRIEGLGAPGTAAGTARNPLCSDGCVNDGKWAIGTPDVLPGDVEGVDFGFFPTPGSNYENLAHQVGSWKAYAESMPRNCYIGDAGSTTASNAYVPRHVPELYFNNLNNDLPFSGTTCAPASALSSRAVPLADTTHNDGDYVSGNLHDDVIEGDLPSFSTVTPNLCDDMHSTCSFEADCGQGLTTSPTCVGDQWLRGILPMITSGPDYQSGRLAILIVWDEGEQVRTGSPRWPYLCADYADVCTPLLVLSKHTRAGTVSGLAYDDWSIVRTVDAILGKPLLGNAERSNSLLGAFGL